MRTGRGAAKYWILRGRGVLLRIILIILALLPAMSIAQTDEIQVYDAEIAAPGGIQPEHGTTTSRRVDPRWRRGWMVSSPIGH